MSDYDGMRLIADSPLDAGEGVGHFHQVPTPPPDWMPERFGCPKDAPPAELYRAKTALLNTRTARLALENEWTRLGHILSGSGSGPLVFSSSMAARNLGRSGAASSSLGASGTKDDAIEIEGDEDSDSEGRPLGVAGGVGAVSGATPAEDEEDEEDETYAESEREDIAAGLTDELVSDCDVDDLYTSDWRLCLYGVSEAELREELQQAVYHETFYMQLGVGGDAGGDNSNSNADGESSKAGVIHSGEYSKADVMDLAAYQCGMPARIREDCVRARVDERVRREEAWAAAQEEADDEDDEDDEDDDDDDDDDDEVRC